MSRAAARNRIASLTSVMIAVYAAGCSSGDGDGTGKRSNGGSAGKAADGQAGGGGSGFGNANTGGSAGMSSVSDPGTIDPGDDDCVGQTQTGHPIPVDMYIMLDRSGSMRTASGTGVSKWDAMRSALTSFIADSESDGLGVGLQYFPLGAPGVPDRCLADTECGATGGVCTHRVCRPSAFETSFVPMVCLTDDDCEPPSTGCEPLGVCSLNDMLACFNIGPGNCDVDGDCVALAGECTEYASCETDDYAEPAVAIDALPKNAAALTASLMNAEPIGLTPTEVALTGAIERAALHASDNPTHRVIAVLATDGLPTMCPRPTTETVDQSVDAVVAVAEAGLVRDPSVETYVIGVFAPDDVVADPAGKLNRIAQAGGTQQAFFVDASQDVAQQLLDALAEIRGGTLECEFQLPEPPKGEMLDYQLVNVVVSSDGKPQELFYVKDVAGCEKALFGWYYDVDPEQGGTPTQIRVCEQTCTAFGALPGASVEIKLGCATRGPD